MVQRITLKCVYSTITSTLSYRYSWPMVVTRNVRLSVRLILIKYLGIDYPFR